MKLKIPYLLAAAAAVILFYSCKKELSTETDEGSNFTGSVNTADSNYLDKIFATDSIAGSLDTLWVLFNYDSQKRIKTVVLKQTLNATDSEFRNKFFYNGNDSLPYLVKDEEASVDYYFSYNSSGKLIADSLIEYSPGTNTPAYIHIAQLNYGTNKMYASVRTRSVITGPVTQYTDTFNIDANKNITTADYYLNFPLGNYVTKLNASFDNKLSPYTKVKGCRVVLFSDNLHFDFKNNVSEVNNITGLNYSRNLITGGVPTIISSRAETYTNSYYQTGFLKNEIMTAVCNGIGVDNDWTYYNHTYYYKGL